MFLLLHGKSNGNVNQGNAKSAGNVKAAGVACRRSNGVATPYKEVGARVSTWMEGMEPAEFSHTWGPVVHWVSGKRERGRGLRQRDDHLLSLLGFLEDPQNCPVAISRIERIFNLAVLTFHYRSLGARFVGPGVRY